MKIVFVCTGNASRSAAAEVVLKKMVANNDIDGIELLNSADLIIVMTEHHRNEVTCLLKYDHWDRIVRFNDYCFGESIDLPDPHYQTEYVYRTSFDTIERGCAEIIKKLQQ